MEGLLLYLLKSSLCCMVFFGTYWLLLRNETFYLFNRCFLLAGLITSLFLPLYTYTYQVTVFSQASPLSVIQSGTATFPEAPPLWIKFLCAAYSLITLFLLLHQLLNLVKIKRQLNRAVPLSLKGFNLVRSATFKNSFSFFNYVVLNVSNQTSPIERKLILEHELAHVKQLHWADLLIAQAFCTFQWFNPFSWFYMRAIKLNHEYLADQAVLENGNQTAVYHAALLNQSLGTPLFDFASSFSDSRQVKRFRMMTTPGSNVFKKLAVLVTLPAFALFLLAFAKPKLTVIPIQSGPAQVLELQVNKSELHKSRKKHNTPHNRPFVKRKKHLPPTEVKAFIPAKTDSSTVATAEVPRPVINISGSSRPLIYLDGIEIGSMESIQPKDIQSVQVLKNQQAINAYGEKARNGVILIHSKKTILIP